MSDVLQQPEASLAANRLRDDIEIDVLRLVARVLKGFKIILVFTLLGAAIGGVIAMAMHKVYTAEAVFLPPPKQEVTPVSSLLTNDDTSDLYLGMLASRSVEDSVIEKVHLMDVYHTQLHWIAENNLAGCSKFTVNKNALISIKITTRDPQLSAAIANAYLEALYKLNGEMSASASSHRREFFEAQLLEEKNALNEAEMSMKQMQEKTGMMLPDSEVQQGLANTARLQASIEDAEAALSTLLTSSTEQNPKVIQLRARITTMESQLRQQQASSGNNAAGVEPTDKMPAIMLDYLRKSRELKESDALYEQLNQQYQKSRLASLDPGPQLEVVDPAVVPEHKSGPARTLIVAVTTLFGAVLGLFQVLLYDTSKKLWRKYLEVFAQTDTR